MRSSPPTSHRTCSFDLATNRPSQLQGRPLLLCSPLHTTCMYMKRSGTCCRRIRSPACLRNFSLEVLRTANKESGEWKSLIATHNPVCLANLLKLPYAIFSIMRQEITDSVVSDGRLFGSLRTLTALYCILRHGFSGDSSVLVLSGSCAPVISPHYRSSWSELWRGQLTLYLGHLTPPFRQSLR